MMQHYDKDLLEIDLTEYKGIYIYFLKFQIIIKI